MFLLFPIQGFSQMDAEMTVNVKDTPLRGVLEMVAARSGLSLVLAQDPGVNVTLTQTGVTPRQLLDYLARDQQIEYTISGSELIITRRTVGTNIGDSHLLHLRYVPASDVSAKIKTVMGGDEKILVDERENNLIFMGSRGNFEKIKSLAAMFDVAPKQILIEGLIVETSHNFVRQLGISMSGFGNRTTTPGPNNPNAEFKTVLTGIDSRTLEVRLNAAETNGDAKVISRPKVTTLNNKTATIQSGITFFVKTLSNVLTTDRPVAGFGGGQIPGAAMGAVGAGAGGGLGAVAGGVTSLQAGLNLNILPILVGDDEIKLSVDINNSTSDVGSSVDGIPGILKNSANTTVIVRDKQTAVIAGLVKQNKAKTSGGVPFLQDIPLLGLLFRSREVIDQNNELVIFLTPSIGNPENAKTDSYVGGENEPELEAANRQPTSHSRIPEMAPSAPARR
ncbi:MAG: hypothetical protein KGP28_00545 [Bdellovibrionales bacterium]|nr:hypothetical protein [Bdellovibrionales bacterium]